MAKPPRSETSRTRENAMRALSNRPAACGGVGSAKTSAAKSSMPRSGIPTKQPYHALRGSSPPGNAPGAGPRDQECCSVGRTRGLEYLLRAASQQRSAAPRRCGCVAPLRSRRRIVPPPETEVPPQVMDRRHRGAGSAACRLPPWKLAPVRESAVPFRRQMQRRAVFPDRHGLR
jgi:hypothetical protein